MQTKWLYQNVNQRKNRKNTGFKLVNNELITYRVFVKILYGCDQARQAKTLKGNESPSPWSGVYLSISWPKMLRRHARCLPLAGSTAATYAVVFLAVTAKQSLLPQIFTHATQGEMSQASNAMGRRAAYVNSATEVSLARGGHSPQINYSTYLGAHAHGCKYFYVPLRDIFWVSNTLGSEPWFSMRVSLVVISGPLDCLLVEPQQNLSSTGGHITFQWKWPTRKEPSLRYQQILSRHQNMKYTQYN